MSESQIKHLEFIQSNISRLNQNSFKMKGWAISIVSALLAIYAGGINKKGNVVFIFIAIAATILFWLLDSYYLQQERKFCGVYNDVANLSDKSKRIDIREFEMPLNKYEGPQYCFFRIMWSKTEWSLYLTMLVGLVAGGILIK